MNHGEMLAGFDAFVQRIDKRYAEARGCLEREDYRGAERILAHIAQSHARTALSLRNMLVKTGKLEDK